MNIKAKARVLKLFQIRATGIEVLDVKVVSSCLDDPTRYRLILSSAITSKLEDNLIRSQESQFRLN